MSNIESIDEILERSGVKLNAASRAKLDNAINQQVKLLESSQHAKGAADAINKAIDSITTLHDKLDDFGPELREAFLDMTNSKAGKEILKNEFDTKGKRFNPRELKDFLKDFNNLFVDNDIAKQMGRKNFEELNEKMRTVFYSYHEATPKDKGETLLIGIESVRKWALEKEQESKGSVFSKIETTLSFCKKALGAKLLGDEQAYKENMHKAFSTILVLTVNSSALGTIASASSKFADKIQTERSNNKTGDRVR